MNSTKVIEIDGQFLYYAFLAGSKRILQNQAHINKINVFPVNDKDTGTNLAATVRSVLDNIKPHKSYKTTVNNIAQAALLGARGNSGVIFAQFLYGLSRETINKNHITLSEFADSLKNSIPYIYQALSNPVEGTMLTVIKEWSDYIFSKKNKIQDFNRVFTDSMSTLQKSLQETKSKLEILKQHNLVDAGAKGFVLFIGGIVEFINNTNIHNLISQSFHKTVDSPTHDCATGDITYRYCTEAILKNINISPSQLKEELKSRGDSIVVAGDKKMCRIHIHTNHPDKLMHWLKDKGTITNQKADDMIRQYQTANDRKWNIALVTDSTCDLSQELIDQYQIHMVPLSIGLGQTQYLDKLTITPDQFYQLLKNGEPDPTTSQTNQQTITNLYSRLATHYDAIIAIHITSHFSGTFENSAKAARVISAQSNKPIYVIDSKNISGTLGLMVLRIAHAIEIGLSPETIIDEIEKWKRKTKIYVSVKNLDRMIKSGRISRQKGNVAKFLGIKPIVSLTPDGKSILFGKAFSQKANINKVIRHIRKISAGKPIWNYIVLHAHNTAGAQIYINKMKSITGKEPVSVMDISPVLGVHVGLGTLAVAILFQ